MATPATELVKLHAGQKHTHMISLKHLNCVMPPCRASFSIQQIQEHFDRDENRFTQRIR